MCHKCGRKDPAATLGARCPNDGLALVSEEEHAKAPKDTILGRVIGGKYPVVGIIGSGGMGSVYRAVQEPVGREVALKVIRNMGDEATEASTENLRARFFREAKTVAKLANPSAVTLYDYGAEEDGVLYMVLEFVKGQRVSDVIRSDGSLPPARAVTIACQVLNALAEAHGLGLIHRDLKPDNIMLVRGPWGEEQSKVLDFGIAKVRKDKDNTLETGTGLLLGTPLYMPPEQATARGADTRSDLYSLGVVIFEMLTGGPPFTASTVFEVLLAHREKPVPPFPPEMGIPPALEAAVAKALAKAPEDRFPDAAAMAQALLEALPAAAAASETPSVRTARTGPGTSRLPASLRTPLPTGHHRSNPPTPSALRTPVPPGLKRSGPIAAPTPNPAARQSVPGAIRQSAGGTVLKRSSAISANEDDTAGTFMRSTPEPVDPEQGTVTDAPAYVAPAGEDLPTPAPAARKSSGGLIALVVVLAVVVLGGGGGAAYYVKTQRDAAAKDVHAILDPDPAPAHHPDKPAVPEPPDKQPVVPVPVKPPPTVVEEAGPDASAPPEAVAKVVEPEKPAKQPVKVAKTGEPGKAGDPAKTGDSAKTGAPGKTGHGTKTKTGEAGKTKTGEPGKTNKQVEEKGYKTTVF